MSIETINNKPNGTPLIKCLTEYSKGEEVRILSINVGFMQKRRLANLGLLPGSIIKKKQTAPFKGPLEIIVKGTSLVIGRGLASKIIVDCGKNCSH